MFPADALALYDIPVLNDGSIEVPAFGVMQVSGFGPAKDRDYFKVKRPDGSGKTYLINGPFPIPPQKCGAAADIYRSPGVHVLFEYTAPSGGSTGDPPAGTVLGPVKDKWAIAAEGSGFVTLGDVAGQAASAPGTGNTPSTKRIRVLAGQAKTTPLATVKFIAIESITAASWNATLTELTPGTFLARVLRAGKTSTAPDAPYSGKFKPDTVPADNIRVAHYLTQGVSIATGKGRIGLGISIGDVPPFNALPLSGLVPPPTVEMFNLDCTDIDYTAG